MVSVLIIDDDSEFCEVLQDYLHPHDIALTSRHDMTSGLATARDHGFDVFLLDVMLPDGDGHEVLAEIRRMYPQANVLMLSAQGCDDDRIAALDEGADDYLAKPFNPRELVSRIRAVLRRMPRGMQLERIMEQSRAGLAVNQEARQAFYRGKRLPLTDVEFTLLNVFLDSPGCVLEREELVTRVFQKQFHPLDRSLDMHISRLRRKLSVVDELVDTIKTIRSSGYLFTPPAA